LLVMAFGIQLIRQLNEFMRTVVVTFSVGHGFISSDSD
jgi:hypothetical protein